MDPVTPVSFDNQYFRNLQAGKGLLASDQVLYTDPRSRPTVDAWAAAARRLTGPLSPPSPSWAGSGSRWGPMGTYDATAQC
ncbi:hypothetical protein HU200_037438 [Digitaria exilis]|uniref:Plant heme peroxidase family profile domain-containing protein n=1 Tax=Digitaria exilis TaxID=1010633 RepID=A0A835BEQ3_9POAL|nr:hypothetical protein HU200_037438 [Digitaria exilis]